MGRHPRNFKRKTILAKKRSVRRGMKGWKKPKKKIQELIKRMIKK